MHVPNHLTSPEGAILSGIVAIVLVGVAVSKISKSPIAKKRLPLAGVLGAFVFAAQMLNIPIANIGCSGHLVGGILLASMLGPWLGFLTLSGVLTIQSLIFADGGILALGWNIVNMAAIGSLIVYPLIFRPIAERSTLPSRSFLAALSASIVAVVLGALGVVLEVSASGISMLPTGTFAGYMLPTHIAIGALEGVITGAIVAFVASREPALLECNAKRGGALRVNYRGALISFAVASLIVGGVFSLVASERPDGLEWSIERTLEGGTLTYSEASQQSADSFQESIALAPDYEGSYTGLLATAGILLVAWVSTAPITRRKREVTEKQRGR